MQPLSLTPPLPPLLFFKKKKGRGERINIPYDCTFSKSTADCRERKKKVREVFLSVRLLPFSKHQLATSSLPAPSNLSSLLQINKICLALDERSHQKSSATTRKQRRVFLAVCTSSLLVRHHLAHRAVICNLPSNYSTDGIEKVISSLFFISNIVGVDFAPHTHTRTQSSLSSAHTALRLVILRVQCTVDATQHKRCTFVSALHNPECIFFLPFAYHLYTHTSGRAQNSSGLFFCRLLP